jgi:hypothetical protein
MATCFSSFTEPSSGLVHTGYKNTTGWTTSKKQSINAAQESNGIVL